MTRDKNKAVLFTNGKKINKVTITKDWKIKVNNFLKEANYDNNSGKYWTSKEQLKKITGIRNVNNAKPNYFQELDKRMYPCSILKEDKGSFFLDKKDIDSGLAFFKKNYQESYLEKVTHKSIKNIIDIIIKEINKKNYHLQIFSNWWQIAIFSH